MPTNGILYLIPNIIAENSADKAIPAFNSTLLSEIKHFVCEHPKSLRALLKAVGIPSPYDDLTLFELNNHTEAFSLNSFIEPLLKGHNIGLVSDAGCPGVADPGAQIVALAHSKKIQVVPLVGPSSILMALMASGFNGQNFTFKGYLPHKEGDLRKELQEMERLANTKGESQIFIEAPFRNKRLLDFLVKYLAKNTQLCIAKDLMGAHEMVKTQHVGTWAKQLPEIDKYPTVFVIGC